MIKAKYGVAIGIVCFLTVTSGSKTSDTNKQGPAAKKVCKTQIDNNLTVGNLRCEYRMNPLGIDVKKPRLSWIIESSQRGQAQSAYQILVAYNQQDLANDNGELWDTGKVNSNQSIHVEYAGKKLKSKMKCWWKVRVWGKNGKVSSWSEPAMFSMGLLNKSDWNTSWIGADWQGDWRKENAPPAPWLRKEFALKEKPKSATAYICALGYYELYINGTKVDDYVLSPAVSDHSKRALYVTHDVTNYIAKGKNCVVLWLGRGWYTKDMPGVIHDGPLVKAKLDIEASGQTISVGTDESWKVHPSPITPVGGAIGGNYGGERYDARTELAGFSTIECDDSSWERAKIFEPVPVVMAAQVVQPDRICQTITPVAVEELSPDVYLLDMGRHFTGWFEINFHSGQPAGHKILMEYVDQRLPEKLITYKQHDEYICRGKGQERFRCRFNYHGFRWVKITGLKYRPEPSEAKGYLIYTNNASVTEFECSNDLLNRIHQTVRWTYRCLSLGGYIVDCPTRERLGYGGDSQTSMEMAMLNFDMGALFTKWLADWRDTQDPKTGDIPHIAPMRCYAGGGPAWSGICVTMPWELYRYYGDKQILRVSYPTMKKWIAFLDSKARDNILEFYTGIGNNLKEWSFLGDWVPPGRGMSPGTRVDDHSTHFFNNCYYLYNVQLASRVAKALSEDADALMYEQKAEILKDAIHKRFFDSDKNSYANGEQPYLAFSLLVDLVPAELRSKVMDNLQEAILVKQGGHLNSGMHGTYYMLKLLMEEKRNDLIFEIASKKTFPSWGYMLQQGATTIWEQWDGEHSQIHNTFLTIGAWFIKGIGGIQVDDNMPGFKHFVVRPAVVADLTFARTKYQSIHGTIVSDWCIRDGLFQLNTTIPVNTTATVYIPAGNADDVTESNKPVGQVEGVRFLGIQSGRAVYRIGSGSYTFVSKQIGK